MKDKRNSERTEIKSKNKREKYNGATLLIVAGTLLGYFFYMKTKSVIMNYPNYLYYILFFIIAVLLFILHYSNFKIIVSKIKRCDLYLYVALNLGKNFIIAWFLAGIMLIPFNYYNIHTAKENSIEIINCEIKGISTYSQHRNVFFVLNERTNVIYGFKPIMEEIKDNGKFNNYYFIAEFRKGLLGSYILESWDIQKK